MRLVTVNLLSGYCVPGDLERFLADFQPDVMCCQEVGHDTARVLSRHFRYGSLRPAFGAMGRAMMSQHPIQVEEVELPFRSGDTATLTNESGSRPGGGDGGVHLISVHLANPLDPRSGVRARRRQLAALEPWLVGKGPLLLVGDLNATPIWPAYRKLRRHLDDLVADHGEAAGVVAPLTWAKVPGGRSLLRIDHVLGRGVRATSVQVERLQGVDHLALVVDLEEGS